VVSVGSDQIKIEGVTRVEDGARDYLDLAATYNFADMGAFSNLSARLGINNVADKDPPAARGEQLHRDLLQRQHLPAGCTTRWGGTSSWDLRQIFGGLSG
jgi:outer membrane receptor protein involved in Fe transport